MVFEQERKIMNRRWPELSEIEDRLHGILVPKTKEQAIRPEEFMDLYGEKKVQEDIELVSKLEKRFHTESNENDKTIQKRGELFEAIVSSQIEESNWMGENAFVITPSRYDDIVNGIDGIVEFEIGSGVSYLAMAIDITKSKRGLEEKLNKIKTSIKAGTLSRVKYMSSRNFRGEFVQLPRVVIGADQHTMENISELILNFKMMQRKPGKNGERFKKTRDALESHKLQFQILYEIKAELEAFKKYADSLKRKNNRENQDAMIKIIDSYDAIIEIIDNIISEKIDLQKLGPEELEEHDEVHKAIMQETRSFN